ncbi:uncharacterized protein N7482_006823 [Penicillium canariense]|uniref:Uncharacterized protein n=1 Tax=Penicillium canariense TaxID=189055 RepID=A0A9W9HX11_9EURO|nr:uncharacterized protein N7482_006823 [Penicillium canariense]KAJ5159819.1 hypothetical protein N7482_006823 [Penicillium canariense]
MLQEQPVRCRGSLLHTPRTPDSLIWRRPADARNTMGKCVGGRRHNWKGISARAPVAPSGGAWALATDRWWMQNLEGFMVRSDLRGSPEGHLRGQRVKVNGSTGHWRFTLLRRGRRLRLHAEPRREIEGLESGAKRSLPIHSFSSFSCVCILASAKALKRTMRLYGSR